MSDKTGQCMCGAVTFTATNVPATFGACHCEMCRRWTGSALLGVTVPETDVKWTNEAQIKTLQSSEWAERAWCQRCGTGLYYRLTMDGPMAGNLELPIGLFDDSSDMTMKSEIFIDCKSRAFAYAGDGRDTMTRAEVFAKYAPDQPDQS